MPYIGGPTCVTINWNFFICITVIRSIFDFLYLLNIILKFHTAIYSPGRGDLVVDKKEIAMHYLKTDLIIDFAATLPLPQVNSTYMYWNWLN